MSGSPSESGTSTVPGNFGDPGEVKVNMKFALLISVGLTDFYIRMLAAGVFKDIRIL